jgi:hypothetical protein
MGASHRDAIRKIEHGEAFPLVALQAIRELRGELEAAEAAAILRARDLGASLADVADAMQVSRQAVAYRLKTIEARRNDVVDVPDLETSS